MKIFKDNENDILNEIEAMSPEQCKGLLEGFFLGIEFNDRIKDFVDDFVDRVDKKIRNPRNEYRSLKRDPTRQDFRKIKLEFCDREDAVEVLDDLREELESRKDGYVPVRSLYSLADLPTNNVMLNWVWYDLEDCEITREADHYILKMPPAERRPEPKKDRDSDIS